MVINHDGTTQSLPDGELSLEFMQSVVGGYVKIAHIGNNMLLVCNEEGKLIGLPLNVAATTFCLAHGFNDTIVGNVIICDTTKLDNYGNKGNA